MKDESNNNFEGLRLDDDDELNALTLSTLLNSGVEEALSSLTPEQLMRLAQNVEKLKKQKSSGNKRRAEGSPKKRKSIDEDEDLEVHRPRSSGGQFMNLPASAPQVEVRDGTEFLLFTYSTKGHIQEYCIRIDIDEISLDDIPDDFKSENCVYPRALVPREAYIGNRYEYENIVNEIAWKLTWVNPSILSGKRGLVQRAVDSYRNRTSESRSRRVLRQEKLSHGTLRRRTDTYQDSEPHHRGPKTLTFNFINKGEASKVKIRVDIESVDINQLDESFKVINSIYPQAYEEKDAFPDSRWEYENSCNELAWKLAWLNAQKLSGHKILLQRAVDAYNSRYDQEKIRNFESHIGFDLNGTIQDGEFSDMVTQTLQQALANEEIYSNHLLQDHLDGDDDSPQTVSTADLLLNH